MKFSTSILIKSSGILIKLIVLFIRSAFNFRTLTNCYMSIRESIGRIQWYPVETFVKLLSTVTSASDYDHTSRVRVYGPIKLLLKSIVLRGTIAGSGLDVDPKSIELASRKVCGIVTVDAGSIELASTLFRYNAFNLLMRET